MPSAADFHRDHLRITNKYVMLLSSQLYNAGLEPRAGAGNHKILPAASYQLHFALKSLASTRTQYLVDIATAAGTGTAPCWFLPWEQNAATEFTIPAGAAGPNVFFTSMLSGCSVRVTGTAASPTVCHANAAETYNTNHDTQSKLLTKLGLYEDDMVFDLAESRANTAANGQINALLPGIGGGVASGIVRKADYAAKATPALIAQAKQRYKDRLGFGKKVTKFDVSKLGQFKPKPGGFVYGIRNPTTDHWAFFYQASLEMKVEVTSKFGLGKTVEDKDAAIVVGTTTRFFP